MLQPIQSHITIYAEDGYRLAGTLFEPRSPNQQNRVVLVNSGAGIPASYYGRFAAWLAAAGTPTLTYDYRGIGLSRPPSLRRFCASVKDWGSKDCAAAIQMLAKRFPHAKIAVVGHSIGCFLTGFVDWRPVVDRMLFVAPHTGFYGDYAPNWRPAMWFAWHVAMPAVTRLFGYFPGRLLGLPEDLPHDVALEWAARRRPEFWWNLRLPDGAPDVKLRDELLRRFSGFRGNVLAIRIADDAFATSLGSKRVASLYRNLEWVDMCISPAQIGERNIGHFGFFRSLGRDSLWPIALDWLQMRTRNER